MDVFGPAFSPGQAIVTLLGALISAAIGAAITYFVVVKRKRLTFWVSESEDLTALLRTHKRAIMVKVDGKDMRRLNRAKVVVQNTGNATVTNIEFTVVMNGNHDFVASEVDSQSIKLRQQITETWTEGGVDPYLTVKLPFFNEGESFEIQIFFDGKTDQCSVYCRMEDVSVRMKSLGYGDVIGVAGVLLGLIPIVGGVGEAGAKLLSKSIGRTKRR